MLMYALIMQHALLSKKEKSNCFVGFKVIFLVNDIGQGPLFQWASVYHVCFSLYYDFGWLVT